VQQSIHDIAAAAAKDAAALHFVMGDGITVHIFHDCSLMISCE
jgi:hypothetical protein